MKKILLSTFVLVLIVAQGCRKEGSGAPTLSGRWKLVSTSGGIAGSGTVYGPGTVYILQFRSDSTYLRILNGTAYENGRYGLSSVHSNGIITTFISFKNTKDTLSQILQFRGRNLVLGDNAADGFEDLYKTAVLTR